MSIVPASQWEVRLGPEDSPLSKHVLVASGSVLVSQTYAQAQDVTSGLESQLGGVGVTAVFPDSPLYANASRPCEYRSQPVLR